MKKSLFIGLCLLVSGLFGVTCPSSITQPTLQPTIFSLVAKQSTENIHWSTDGVRHFLIVAKENNPSLMIPMANVNYDSNGEFRKGTNLDGGFLVYEGNGNTVEISGLRKGTKYYFSIYEINAEESYIQSQTTLISGIPDSKLIPIPPVIAVSCVCPPIAGVTCTISGSTTTGTSVASAAGCPHVGYCDGPGINNPWTSAAGTGTMSYAFSSPVSAATLRANSVNTNDFATISAAGGSGGALSISGVVCMGVSGLVIGPMSVAGSYGGVSWTVNSTGSYTVVNCLNTGAQSGWVAACPTAVTTVLPIELFSLKAKCNNEKVDISWQTLTEHNNSYFTIERSYYAEVWEVLGKIAGMGNSTKKIDYNFPDVNPVKGNPYYRLKQTDFSGEFKYSELVIAENCKGKEEVNVYPNPAKDKITIKNDKASLLEIYNILGEKAGEFILDAGENTIDTEAYNNGTYFLKFTMADLGVKFLKVVINK